MDTIQTSFTGSGIANDLAQSYIWALVGSLFMMLYNINKGWKTSERTTEMFSIREVFTNPKNYLRFALTVLSVGITINFMGELLNMHPNGFNGLLIGLSSSLLADAIASRQNVVPNKIKSK